MMFKKIKAVYLKIIQKPQIHFVGKMQSYWMLKYIVRIDSTGL
jgi:uncharacterized pyridoxamine 5'-phosphate oxidase family protein